MKSYNHLYEKLVSIDNIKYAIQNASKGKRKQKYVVYCLKNLDVVARKIINKIECLDFVISHNIFTIYEGTHNKVRKIIKPSFDEQIIHHSVIQILRPIIEKSFYKYSCGSIPNRGLHKAKEYLEKALKDTELKYVLKLDIKKFYENVDKKILKKKLSKLIHDKRFLNILYKIIDTNIKGLPLGFYTSQWFANYFLTDVDYFIKQKLKAKYYIRYLDDIVILHSNKRKLHNIRLKIKYYLKKYKKLSIKENWQLFKINSRPIDFLGFHFYIHKITLRKSLLKRLKRKVETTRKRLNLKNAMSMISYMGWIKYSDSKNLYNKIIKPKINIKQLKLFVGGKYAKVV